MKAIENTVGDDCDELAKVERSSYESIHVDDAFWTSGPMRNEAVRLRTVEPQSWQ